MCGAKHYFRSCRYSHYNPARVIEGAIKDRVDRRDDTTTSKIRAYRKEGIKVLDHIGYIGDEMRKLLKEFK